MTFLILISSSILVHTIFMKRNGNVCKKTIQLKKVILRSYRERAEIVPECKNFMIFCKSFIVLCKHCLIANKTRGKVR